MILVSVYPNFIKKQSQIYIQDTYHIGAKLKNRFVKHSIILTMGTFIASKAHLQIAMQSLSKVKHRLIEKDLNEKDKMNFVSVTRICSRNIV